MHRIASKNAFLACCCEAGKPHAGQFLICEECGATLEIPGDELASRSPPVRPHMVSKYVIRSSN